MKLVLATEANKRFFHLLDDLGSLDVEVVPALDEDSLRREIVDADAVYGWPSPEALARAEKLSWVHTSSAGVEQLWSHPQLRQSDIVVTNSRGAHAANIAEHALAMLLAFSRGIIAAREYQAAGQWAGTEVRAVSWELSGSTMGIIGYGNIGRATGARAQALGMKVLAVDREPVAPDAAVATVGPLAKLADVLAAADVVVVTVPETPESRGMLGAEQFAMMKPSAGLIVVSRGATFDHDALVAALRSEAQGPAFAGLDSTPIEPLPQDSPLWSLPNCLLTPHSSGHSLQKEQRVIALLKENVQRFAQGQPLINIVDKAKGY